MTIAASSQGKRRFRRQQPYDFPGTEEMRKGQSKNGSVRSVFDCLYSSGQAMRIMCSIMWCRVCAWVVSAAR